MQRYTVLLMLLALFIVGLALEPLLAEKTTDPVENYAVIDAHLHLDFEGSDLGQNTGAGFVNTPEVFLAQAKMAGVKAFVAHTRNEMVRLPTLPGMVPTFCVGIREEINLELVEAGLNNKNYKCIKIYLGYVHRYAYDPVYKPLYQLALKYGVPVVFHTGDTDSAKAKLKYSDPLTVDEVAVDHPQIKIVIAHMGNPWIQSAAEVAYKNPNVYLDASAILIGDIKTYSQEEVRRFLIEPMSWVWGYAENTEKLMFGTDWPLVDIVAYKQAALKAIPVKFHKAFLHDNAAKVFNIDVN